MTDYKAPCKGCLDRKIPKTCERTCEKWREYKNNLDKEKEKIKFAKDLEKAIKQQIWRNSNANY